MHDIRPRYGGLPVHPSIAAVRELDDLGLDVIAAVEILERGEICGQVRAKDTIEKCALSGRRTKVVVAHSYHLSTDETVWVITHVGICTRH